MRTAEFSIEQRSTKTFQNIVDNYLVGWFRQHLSSLIAGCTIYKAFHPQNTGKLRNVMAR